MQTAVCSGITISSSENGAHEASGDGRAGVTKKIAELQQLFQDKWGVEKWGDIHTFLGMRFKYDRSAGVLTLDVEHKIKGMLKRFP